MDNLITNKILNRSEQENQIKSILRDFENNKNNLLFKKGIYVYGEPGTGKSTFVTNILNELNYDIIKYDAGDIRNSTVMEDITKHNMSDMNIMSIFNKKITKNVIVMDEIDGMNNGDKGGINSLIKLIRPKKTKKQKIENSSMSPIICIGNYKNDKKIKELMKVCNTIELKSPNTCQIVNIINNLFVNINDELKTILIKYIQGDLRKLNNMYNLYKNKSNLFTYDIIKNIFQIKSYNDDTKKIINNLITNYHPFNEHTNIMNETDRTSVGLLWHENIIEIIDPVNTKQSISFYLSQLDNICFSDYIDRITFQKQIWQFNEMTSLIKTFKNHKLYHEYINLTQNKHLKKTKKIDVIFTKVLTKYSTEYNNSIFIQKMCQMLGMDKRDMFSFFIELISLNDTNKIINILEEYDISKLDVNRIYRYIEKYIKENASGISDNDIEEYENEDLLDE